MGKNGVYAVLIVAGLAGLYFYAWPKYRAATGANLGAPTTSAPAPVPAQGKSRETDGY
jgi:hypothetical protein